MKRIVMSILALFMTFTASHAYTPKEREAIGQIIIASTIAVAVCNEKELPNLDFRGSAKVMLMLALKYEDIATQLDPMAVKAFENKFASMSTKEKYKFCMDLYKAAPNLFEDRESGTPLGGNK